MTYKYQMSDIKSVVLRQSALHDFVQHLDVFMERTAWTISCRSWFKNGKVDGPVTALHLGSRLHWLHVRQDIRYEDYEWETLGNNRFSYLSNGFSVKETSGSDIAYYLVDLDKEYESIVYT